MEDTVFKSLIQQGPYAILFVWLLFHTMKNNKDREAKLTEILDKFSEKYDVVISEIRDIKNKIDK